MVEWTNVERSRILELYFKSGSICKAQRDFKSIYKVDRCPSRNTILSYAKKFHETGSAQATSPPGRSRSVRTAVNIAYVREALQLSPRRSIRELSQALNIKRTSLRRMLTNDVRPRGWPAGDGERAAQRDRAAGRRAGREAGAGGRGAAAAESEAAGSGAPAGGASAGAAAPRRRRRPLAHVGEQGGAAAAAGEWQAGVRGAPPCGKGDEDKF